MSVLRTIRVATRGSRLALAQTEWVVARLREAHPGLDFQVVTLRTAGDRTQRAGIPLSRVGGKGLFTRELEEALLDGRVDLAVHSLKDLPSDLPSGLTLGCVPPREDPRDALLSPDGRGLRDLAPGTRVGTSSLRRTAQLRRLRPDLELAPVRGNVDTRLRKLATGQYGALVMAAAGLHRLGLRDRISAYLAPEECLPAAGQGALGIEVRDGDEAILALLRPLHDPVTAAAVRAERAFLARLTEELEGRGPVPGDPAAGVPGQAPPLSGTCQVPVAAHAALDGDRLHLHGLVALPDGSRVVKAAGDGPADAPEQLGRAVAETVLRTGGRQMLRQAHGLAGEEGESP
ncbi:hydroxymethylbilane synthase [Caldinitratiruptor microaerophilus]|uniref:Porphobilinogen deaminase n=1 Tax=Caldinitratiruptor microaerophilus TaxID=671077 RepID=A0AA35G8F7_9FIRM|nr:hydroxymethylbilane synthase [Caldinitratiruptor microaerophilus]BDG59224.1 porphobilinogen deaminase [Caldinitratiruptor microaerophilus]